MDALYDEYCFILPHQQAIMRSGAPVVEKWATLLKHTHTKHDSISFFPLECTNHQCFGGEGLFTDDRMLDGHKEQINLIKSEIQVKNNFTFSCKDFYTYVVKDKVLLNDVRSNKKYKLKKKPEGKKPSYVRPHLS